MRINIKATSIALTAASEGYLFEKLAQLDKWVDRADESGIAQVEIGKDTRHHKHGDVFRAEINLHIAGGNFYASETASDLYAAIDLVKDEMIRQLQSAAKKKNTLLRRGGRKIKQMLRGLYPWRLQ